MEGIKVAEKLPNGELRSVHALYRIPPKKLCILQNMSKVSMRVRGFYGNNPA
jgi:hypothetical protein